MTARRTWLLRLGGLAVSAVAVWLVVRSIDIAATARILARTDPLPLLVAMGVIALQVLLRSLRWRSLLPHRPGGERVALLAVAPVLLVGYLGNTVLPARLGEPLRAYLLARRESLDAAEVFGSAALERILDVATLAVVASLAALAVRAPTWVVQGTVLAAIVGTTLVVLLATGVLLRALRALSRSRAGRYRIVGMGERFVLGAGGRQTPTVVLVAALLSVAAWLLDGGTFWLVGRAIGVDLPPAGALLIAAITVLGTALPSAPGYVGTFELAATGVAGILGIAPEPALALAVLAHATTGLPLALAGAVSLVRMSGDVGRLGASAELARRASLGVAAGADE